MGNDVRGKPKKKGAQCAPPYTDIPIDYLLNAPEVHVADDALLAQHRDEPA